MRQGWEEIILGELCEILDSKRKPITKRNRIEGEIPYYGATGIVDWVKDYIFDEKLILLGEDGAKWNSGDETAFAIEGKTWVNNHAHVLKPLRDKVLDNWLINYLNFQNLELYVTGLTVPKLNQGNMRSIPIPIPPLYEQKRIVAKLDQCFEAIDKARANVEKNLNNAKELFQSKLNEIFSQKGEDWVEKKLGDICERVSVGHVGKTSEYYCGEDGIPFLRSQNVRKGYLDFKNIRYITKDFHESLKKSQLCKGDLLFVRVGANRGDCSAIKEDYNELNCANIVFARPTSGNVKFLEYYCLSPIGRNRLLGMTTGSAQGVINTKSVEKLKISMPIEIDQNSIVSTLDDLRKKTKSLEYNYRQELDALDELKKSILQKAFNGEL